MAERMPKKSSPKNNCDHSVVMKDMCAICGENLRTKDGMPGERTKKTDARVAMVHSIPELQITLDEAKKLGAADEENIIGQRKLVLLVDLDQTLIHTTNEDVDPKTKDVYHFQLCGSTSPWYHVRLRPNTKHFLQSMSNLYELHICTFGARMYAHKIAEFLDPEGTIFGHRILSRDECFDPALKTANLKALFPCGDRLVCVIDDREDVWNFATNVIQVKPYRYFKNTGDINAPLGFNKTERNTEKYYQFSHPKKSRQLSTTTPATIKTKQMIVVEETADERVLAEVEVDVTVTDDRTGVGNNSDEDDDDDDDYLYYLEEILRRIHTAFYQMYDHMSASDRPPDLHSVIPYVKLKVLKNINLVFSSVIPTNIRPEDTVIYNLAKSFGAVVQDNIVSSKSSDIGGSKTSSSDAEATSATTHLIAGKWGTSKVREAQAIGNIKIVSPQWLWCCAERWERVEEKLFPLLKDADFTKLYSNMEGNVRRIRREFKDATEEGVKVVDSRESPPIGEQTPKYCDDDEKNIEGDSIPATKRKADEMSGDESLTKKFKCLNSAELSAANEEPFSGDIVQNIDDNDDTLDSQDANRNSSNGSTSSSTANEENSDSNDEEIVKALERELSEQKGGDDEIQDFS